MTNDTIGLGWGFGAAGVAVVFFGSNFVPVKKIETGDGLFFQFMVCNAIMLVGVVVNVIQKFPKFYPLVMVGGAMWATGNVCVVPIIKTIGLGLGILIWAIFNMLCGWASGRFGMFGLKAEVPEGNNVIFNYVGVALCAASGFLYMFVKTEVSTGSDATQTQTYRAIENGYSSSDDVPFISPPDSADHIGINPIQLEPPTRSQDDGDWVERLSAGKKRLIGSLLAMGSGVLYGFQFVPYLYVAQHYDGASQNALDYVFAQFVGSYVASLVYLLIYAAAMGNNPRLFPRAVLPGVACGLMWSVADVCWFIANEALGETISFPIITTSPPVITNLWTILLFREIRGRNNFIILAAAFIVTCLGVAFIVISKLD